MGRGDMSEAVLCASHKTLKPLDKMHGSNLRDIWRFDSCSYVGGGMRSKSGFGRVVGYLPRWGWCGGETLRFQQ